MTFPSPEFEDWVARGRAADMVAAAERLGAKLKKASHEWVGPCPSCGGDDRFSINLGKRVFNCRGVGGGDIIAMVPTHRRLRFRGRGRGSDGRAAAAR